MLECSDNTRELMPRTGNAKQKLRIELGKLKMRKVLIIALSLASLATLAVVNQAFAANCRIVCDQWGPDNRGKQRCFSAHQVCKPAMSSAPKSMEDQKRKRQQ